MTRVDYYDDPDAPRANSLVPAVTVVVPNWDGAIALIHRVDNNRWALPGGGVDIGESITQTAQREVGEETGLTIEIVRLVGVYTDPRHVIAYDDGEVRQQFALCFAARLIGGRLREDGTETKEARWIDPVDVPTLNIHPSMQLRINHYLEDRAQPYIG